MMLLRIIAGVCVVVCSSTVRAALITTEHLNNQFFDTALNAGDWTTASTNGTNWVIDGTTPLGPGLGNYATTGNLFSSAHQRLFQDFLLPVFSPLELVSGSLLWRDRYDNDNAAWVDGTQEYRVVLQRLLAGLPVVGTDVEVFSTASIPQDPDEPATDRGSTGNVTSFVLANLGQTVRLSFEVFDSGTIPIVAVDNVSFVTVFDTAAVPEPSSLMLVVLPVLGLTLRRRLRRARGETSAIV